MKWVLLTLTLLAMVVAAFVTHCGISGTDTILIVACGI